MPAEHARRRLGVVCALALLVAAVAGCGSNRRDTIRIGIYGDCYGPFAAFAVQADAGADLAFIRHGAKPNGPSPSAGVSAITVAGKRVELVLGCDLYRSHTSSLDTARRLVEQQGVNILVTPYDVPDDSVGSLYAPRQPGVTFISTGLDPAARLGHNVFRVGPDNRQLSAGLGAYAFHTLGWRTAVTVGEDDSNGYGQTAGFVAEFCSLGGTVLRRLWGSSTNKDWSHVVRKIPRAANGVALMTGLASTKSFFAAYGKLHADVQRRVVMGAEPVALGDRPPPGVMVAGHPVFVERPGVARLPESRPRGAPTVQPRCWRAYGHKRLRRCRARARGASARPWRHIPRGKALHGGADLGAVAVARRCHPNRPTPPGCHPGLPEPGHVWRERSYSPADGQCRAERRRDVRRLLRTNLAARQPHAARVPKGACTGVGALISARSTR